MFGLLKSAVNIVSEVSDIPVSLAKDGIDLVAGNEDEGNTEKNIQGIVDSVEEIFGDGDS